MTIKKRLVISNILMIVVPVITAVVIAVIGMASVWKIIRSGGKIGGSDEQSVYWTSQVTAEIMEQNLAGSTPETQEANIRSALVSLDDFLEANDIRIIVEKNRVRVASEGTAHHEDEELVAVARKLNTHSATASSGTRNVLITLETTGADEWELYVLATQEGHISRELLMAAVAVVFAVIAGVVITVLVMNRFLTGFVIGHIENTLDLLSEGARRIGQGDLDYRIRYSYKDEFSSVCGAYDEMAGRLKESIDQAQRDEESRRMLIAGISHDLRSPLTSVRAYTEGLLDNVASSPEMQKKYLLKIRDKAENIDRMISQLFLFSKLDMGNYPMNLRRVKMDEVLRETASRLQFDLLEKHMQLTSSLEPAEVNADTELLNRVISNILENSTKYKSGDKGHCVLTLKRQDGMAVITAEDDGPGVPEEALGKLFDVFYRSDASRRNPGSGSGLGLAISAHIIHQHGGTIRAENVETGGLRIVITLPLAEEEK